MNNDIVDYIWWILKISLFFLISCQKIKQSLVSYLLLVPLLNYYSNPHSKQKLLVVVAGRNVYWIEATPLVVVLELLPAEL